MQKLTAAKLSEAARAEKLAYDDYWHACRTLTAADTLSPTYEALEAKREETRQLWNRAYEKLGEARNEAIEEALEIPY